MLSLPGEDVPNRILIQIEEGESLTTQSRQHSEGLFAARNSWSDYTATLLRKAFTTDLLDGVLYIPFDDHGAWRLRLARELKGAGFEVDINRAI